MSLRIFEHLGMLHSRLSTLAIVATAASATIVKTSNGTVQGGRCSSSESDYFLSIPFADPPVGELRYQAPQAFSGSYNGILNGTKQAPSCYQFGTSDILSGPQSEDCLYLNIYTPANITSTTALPVKVWLYGGAFEIGGSSDPLYNGCFSSTDAIVVTLNYRLGPLGYLALENTTLSGNYGVLDQLQAIRWVHDNIAAFGGNPKQILLFGQSAGAMASFALATLPGITSLVNAVVMESGGGIDFPTISTAQAFHEEFVNALNCSVTDVACLRSRTPAQLNSTFNQLPASGNGFVFSLHDWSGAAFPWGPVVGSPLFPVQPSQVGVRIPAIFGSNSLEGSIFVLETFGAAGISNLTNKDYLDFLNVNFGSFALTISQQYPLSSFNNSVLQAMSIVVRDYTFRCPACRGASLAAAKGLPVWTYIFNQTPSCPWAEGQPSDSLRLLGASHTAEIPFVFGEVSGLPQPNGHCSFTEGERNISAYMQNAWTNLTRNATPGDWPDFSPNSTLGVTFQDGSIILGPVDYTMCTFWDKIDMAMLKVAGASNTTAGVNGSNTTAIPATYEGGASMASASMLYSLAPVVLVVFGVIYCF
ncbi:carboxylesterase type b [Viridothelium virens]|uniref:Carboxylic ester hydrolase n=1 Tax=Viridothelium virens TaxID=1048519 RepID=A0A6A6H639_VIRVR|nr:carboxylesterase type b [Viridothelium virens]